MAGAARRILLLMLPGARMGPEEFAANGILEALPGEWIDAMPVEVALDLYLAGTAADRIHEVVAPLAAQRRHAEIWLLGISLGGMGALAYARAHPEVVAGVILLAPFLGTRGTVAEVDRLGGLEAWEPDASTRDHPDVALLFWLKTTGHAITRPAIHLGYGRDDRFSAASRLLATRLPTSRVVSVEGGHDWSTWRRLWPRLVGATPLALDAAALPRAEAAA